MKQIFNKIVNYFNTNKTNILLIMMLVVSYQLYKTPYNISNAISGQINNEGGNTKTNTTEVVKPLVAPPLATSGSFIYFEGDKLSEETKSFKIEDNYTYSPKYPSEIWKGYLTPYKASNGAKYYIWTRTPVTINAKLKGWFFGDNLSSLQLDQTDEYLQILYPIIEKE